MHKIKRQRDENARITIYCSRFFRLDRNHKIVRACAQPSMPAILLGYFDCGTCGPLGAGAGAGARCAGKPGIPFCN
jgi:hypothetical protein